jgi:hypothetical protein
MEPPPPPPLSPCLSFFERIPYLEQIIFVEKPPNLTQALQLIKEFFSSIGVSVSPDPDVRSEYPKLIDCKIPVNVISIPGRKESLDKMVKSIHGHRGLAPIITCSVYIEDVLTLILKKVNGDNLNTCVELIYYGPLKERYALLKAYTESPGSTLASGSSAMNDFRSFMFLSHELIIKKLDISILEEQRQMPLIDIISILSRMYFMIQQLIFKMMDEHGGVGILYQKVSDWFVKCEELKSRFLYNINHEIIHFKDTLESSTARLVKLNSALEHARLHEMSQETATSIESKIQQLQTVKIPETEAILLKLRRKREELIDVTQPLIDDIIQGNGVLNSKSQPNTPQRPGGGSKRVKKKNNSKSKKYKKNNSKSKKYKKKYSKTNKCKTYVNCLHI